MKESTDCSIHNLLKKFLYKCRLSLHGRKALKVEIQLSKNTEVKQLMEENSMFEPGYKQVAIKLCNLK
jgi:hypothetical protein